MILSSFTFSVNFSHSLLFENTLKKEAIPFIESQNSVHKVKFYKLLTEIDNGGHTLSLQVFFKDMQSFTEFELNQKDKLLGLIEPKYSGNYAFFHTLLEEL
ncbi:DUF4286 family protein [Jiulongibacter sp. NS-SX5]|uniref:DUF4286 family protein n=1 Tax=Jiulongibacter sp. NS-SX5 TaxID=3463854 RepID=UPI004058B737